MKKIKIKKDNSKIIARLLVITAFVLAIIIAVTSILSFHKWLFNRKNNTAQADEEIEERVAYINSDEVMYKNGYSRQYVEEIRENDIPIPKGFSYVSGHKNTGFIIQNDAKEQFVWIPYDENAKVEGIDEYYKNVDTLEDYDEVMSMRNYGGFYVGLDSNSQYDILKEIGQEQYNTANEQVYSMESQDSTTFSLISKTQLEQVLYYMQKNGIEAIKTSGNISNQKIDWLIKDESTIQKQEDSKKSFGIVALNTKTGVVTNEDVDILMVKVDNEQIPVPNGYTLEVTTNTADSSKKVKKITNGNQAFIWVGLQGLNSVNDAINEYKKKSGENLFIPETEVEKTKWQSALNKSVDTYKGYWLAESELTISGEEYITQTRKMENYKAKDGDIYRVKPEGEDLLASVNDVADEVYETTGIEGTSLPTLEMRALRLLEACDTYGVNAVTRDSSDIKGSVDRVSLNEKFYGNMEINDLMQADGYSREVGSTEEMVNIEGQVDGQKTYYTIGGSYAKSADNDDGASMGVITRYTEQDIKEKQEQEQDTIGIRPVLNLDASLLEQGAYNEIYIDAFDITTTTSLESNTAKSANGYKGSFDAEGERYEDEIEVVYENTTGIENFEIEHKEEHGLVKEQHLTLRGSFKEDKLVIPAEYKGYSITHINANGNDYIKEVYTQSYVKGKGTNKAVVNIEENAFNGCNNLTKVNMESLGKISAGAFLNCHNLENVFITAGNRNLEIGERAFSGCESIQDLKIVGMLRLIGAKAFAETGFTSITIYNSGIIAENQIAKAVAKNEDPKLVAQNLGINEQCIILPHSRPNDAVNTTELHIDSIPEKKDEEELMKDTTSSLPDMGAGNKESNGIPEEIGQLSDVVEKVTKDETKTTHIKSISDNMYTFTTTNNKTRQQIVFVENNTNIKVPVQQNAAITDEKVTDEKIFGDNALSSEDLENGKPSNVQIPSDQVDNPKPSGPMPSGPMPSGPMPSGPMQKADPYTVASLMKTNETIQETYSIITVQIQDAIFEKCTQLVDVSINAKAYAGVKRMNQTYGTEPKVQGIFYGCESIQKVNFSSKLNISTYITGYKDGGYDEIVSAKKAHFWLPSQVLNSNLYEILTTKEYTYQVKSEEKNGWKVNLDEIVMETEEVEHCLYVYDIEGDIASVDIQHEIKESVGAPNIGGRGMQGQGMQGQGMQGQGMQGQGMQGQGASKEITTTVNGKPARPIVISGSSFRKNNNAKSTTYVSALIYAVQNYQDALAGNILGKRDLAPLIMQY